MSILANHPLESHQDELPATAISPHRWTLAEYQQLGDAGLLGESRTELIDGEIFDMPPQKNWHRVTVSNLFRMLALAFDKRQYWVTCQATMRLAAGQAPEPDVALEMSQPEKVAVNVISQPLLVIEVSDESLAHDRRMKGSLYASCGVQDYWIVNLVDRQLEVYRQPAQDAAGKWQYAQRLVLRPPEKVSPLCKPDASFDIAEKFT